jgi:hypothetical protein
MPLLSKSRFVAGLQCPLRLWYQCHEPKLATGVTPAQQAIFDVGHEVGRLATELYPGGVLIAEDHRHHREAERATARALADPDVKALFEGAFTFGGIRIRVDILEKNGDGSWNLVEVKSSTALKDVYKPDVAVQYHVLKGAGLRIAKAGLLNVNNRYVFDGGALDLAQLFQLTDLTGEVAALQEELADQIARLKEVIALEAAPAVPPSRHCFHPYKCEFWEHCTAGMPDSWVIHLAGISQDKLTKLREIGIDDINDIPDGFPLTAVQDRIRDCVTSSAEYVDPELLEELQDARHPIHFLDFETFATAVPRYAGTRPYQTMPFQWSDHVLQSDGSLEHLEYLCQEDMDPRREFAESLIASLGKDGTIYVYTSYEKGILRQLVEAFPEYAGDLQAIVDRFKDLYDIIRKQYYHPGFRGSFSLKSVLPALMPAMSYSHLNIQDGALASLAYLRMIDAATEPAEKSAIKADLLTYCSQDTLAMVKIREELLARAGGSGRPGSRQ